MHNAQYTVYWMANKRSIYQSVSAFERLYRGISTLASFLETKVWIHVEADLQQL